MSERWLRTLFAAIEKKLDPDQFGQRRFLDLLPQFRKVEEALGDEERSNHLGQGRAFFLGEIERCARSKPIDDAVGDPRREDFVAQAVGADRIRMRLAHRLGEGVRKLATNDVVVGKLQVLRGILQRQLRHRQDDRQLGPSQSAVLLAAAKQLLAAKETFDLAVDSPAGLEQLDRPDERRKPSGTAAFGNGKRQRLQPVVLENHLGDLVRHLGEERVALLERQASLAHLSIERDLDVHFLVRAVDAGAVVDKVGVDPAALFRKIRSGRPG